MARFDGKLALVTGGTSGIGLATARLLIEEGGHVIVTGCGEDGLNSFRTEFGDRVTAIRSDTASMTDIEALAEPALGHRMALAYDPTGQGGTLSSLIQELAAKAA